MPSSSSSVFSFHQRLPFSSDSCVVLHLFLECRSISMGQGQDVHARRLMNLFVVSGGWVLLQNCHLSLDYVIEVMDQVLETETIHEDFRLWVTTEVHPRFPITFLQACHSVSLSINLNVSSQIHVISMTRNQHIEEFSEKFPNISDISLLSNCN